VSCKTEETQAKFTKRSSGKIQISATFEETRQIVWKEAKVLKVETNSVYRKYMEAAYMSSILNPRTEISPI
jgi:hypothetical protein